MALRVEEAGDMNAKSVEPTLSITVLQFLMKMTSPEAPKPELYKKLLLLLADCLKSKLNLTMYQSYLTIVFVFLVVKSKS